MIHYTNIPYKSLTIEINQDSAELEILRFVQRLFTIVQ